MGEHTDDQPSRTLVLSDDWCGIVLDIWHQFRTGMNTFELAAMYRVSEPSIHMILDQARELEKQRKQHLGGRTNAQILTMRNGAHGVPRLLPGGAGGRAA